MRLLQWVSGCWCVDVLGGGLSLCLTPSSVSRRVPAEGVGGVWWFGGKYVSSEKAYGWFCGVEPRKLYILYWLYKY